MIDADNNMDWGRHPDWCFLDVKVSRLLEMEEVLLYSWQALSGEGSGAIRPFLRSYVRSARR